MKRIMMIVSLMILLLGCEGKQGPVGPEGPAGPGSRVVYQSTTKIVLDPHTVSVPEITINDMPSVTVYLSIDGTSLWFEIPLYFENYPNWGMACFLEEGLVTFSQCQECFYKIVVVR